MAIISFVCSIGNVPLAAVLWVGGSSFGGVIAFLYADLIVLPILDIYRKYYGRTMSLFLLITMYVAMGLAALGIEFLFGLLHLIPQSHQVQIVESSIRFDYTTILNLIFGGLAGVLISHFSKTGGPQMLRHMD